MSKDTRFLSEDEWAVLNRIEQFYISTKTLPTVEDLVRITGKTQDACRKLFARLEIPLRERGIEINPTRGLSPEQIQTVNLIMLPDGRSVKSKLRDIGLPQATYERWKLNPNFQAYVRQRGEDILGNSLHEVKVSLLESATGGKNVRAAELVLEMTGEFTRGQDSLSAKVLLVRILDILSRHLSGHPELLGAIGDELLTLAAQVTPSPVGVLAPSRELENRGVPI